MFLVISGTPLKGRTGYATRYVFGVDETLLDMSALGPYFEQSFGDASVRHGWFDQLFQSAPVAAVTDAYADFGAMAWQP